MFLISTISLTVTIIKAKKSKLKILPLVLSIVGVIIGSALTVPVFFMISVSREADKKTASSYIDTGTVTYWENEKLYEKEFILNDRRYKYLLNNGHLALNEPLANIDTKKKENEKPGLWRKIIGPSYGEIVYSLKDNDDYTLLAVGGHKYNCFDLFCDVEFFTERKEYYDNDNNFDFYITKVANKRIDMEEFKILARPVQREEYFELNDEFRFNYSVDYNVVSDENEYEHINLFKISKDGIIKIPGSSVILDNDKIYDSTYESYQKIRVYEFSKERTDYILSLLE